MLTKWYLEVLPGIFVATVNARVRDEIWNEIQEWVDTDGAPGFAALIHAAPNEQGYAIRTAGENRYEPIDLDGLVLVARRHDSNRRTSGKGTKDDPDDWGF